MRLKYLLRMLPLTKQQSLRRKRCNCNCVTSPKISCLHFWPFPPFLGPSQIALKSSRSWTTLVAELLIFTTPMEFLGSEPHSQHNDSAVLYSGHGQSKVPCKHAIFCWVVCIPFHGKHLNHNINHPTEVQPVSLLSAELGSRSKLREWNMT